MKRFSPKHRFLFAPLFIAGFAGLGLLTMLIWNAIIPEIFHLTAISFWQALGLMALGRLILGFPMPWHGGGQHHQHHHDRGLFREKWEQMNPQEQDEFRNQWKKRHDFWNRVKEEKTTNS